MPKIGKFFYHSVTTDILIFTLKSISERFDPKFKILLVKRAKNPFQDYWALPGGFVTEHEDLLDCAVRELKEETNFKVTKKQLRELGTYGRPKRDPRGRVITIAYYAILPWHKSKLKAATDTKEVEWFDVDSPPNLAFDHAVILKDAIARLRKDGVSRETVAQFLPTEFTLPEFRKSIEAINGEKMKDIEKRNLYRWIKVFAEKTGEKEHKLPGEKQGVAADLYKRKD